MLNLFIEKLLSISFIFSFRRDVTELLDQLNENFVVISDLLKEAEPEPVRPLLEVHVFYSYVLFFLSVTGILLSYGSLIRLLLFFELGMLGVGLHFIYASHYFFDPTGQLAAIVLFVIAGVESAFGLSLFLLYFRVRGGLDFKALKSLKG